MQSITIMSSRDQSYPHGTESPKEQMVKKQVIINYKMRNGVNKRRVKMEKWEKSNLWRRSHYKR